MIKPVIKTRKKVSSKNQTTSLHRYPAMSNMWLAFFCLVLAVFLSLWRGQDANWDLLNYHYYNPYAWVNNRATLDIAPAQLQSFHSPFADLPYYYIVRAGLPSWAGCSILALPAATALFFLGLIFKQLAPNAKQPVYLIAAVVLGATGAAGGPLIGTTMSEWHLVALFFAAIWLILRLNLPEFDGAGCKKERRIVFAAIILAGLLGGLAVGLKLTASTYSVGLAVLVFMLPTRFWLRVQCVALLGFGGLVGALIAYGPWGYELWHRFGNPFFPYFNDIFQSPWAESVRFADTRYVSDSAAKLLTTPWIIMRETVGYVSEAPFRDWRIGLGLPAFIWLAWRTRANAYGKIWLALLLTFLTIYICWISFFGYYRYVSMLEALSALAMVGLSANLFESRASNSVTSFMSPRRQSTLAHFVMIFFTALIVGTAKWPSWGKVPHGEMVVSAVVPTLPKGSMVMMSSLAPLAFIAPNFPPEIPVVSVINNFLNPFWGAETMLHRTAAKRLREHQGPLFGLVNRNQTHEIYYMNVPIEEMLAALGLKIDFDDCKPIATKMPEIAPSLCSVRRITVVPPKWPR